MPRLLWLVLALLLALGAPGTARAQELPSWYPLGFEGARVEALASGDAGQTLYLATELGPQASFDGGENWHYIGADLDRQSAPLVTTLALDPRDARVVYAGTEPGEKGGLYRSRDGGQHWERLFSGQRQDGVRAFFLPSTQPAALYLSSYASDAAADELWVSADGGANWRSLLPAGSGLAQRYYDISMGSQQRLLVASSTGLLRANEDGQRFRSVSTSQVPVYTIARRAGADEGLPALYASTAAGVIVSQDGGASWRSVTGLSLGSCQNLAPDGLAVAYRDVPIVVVGTRSRCQGTPARLMMLVPDTSNRRSRWSDGGTGLPSQSQLRLAKPEPEQSRVYALTEDGLWALDLPRAEGEPTPDPTPAGSDTAPPPDDVSPLGQVDVEDTVGEPEASAVGRWLDVALWAVGLPTSALLALRWLKRRQSPKE
ncbi:MAG: WD40/YVTN/BNR-like repeat-containing protein [Chloroflexota bacterium]